MSSSQLLSTKIIEARPLLLDRFRVVRVLGEGAAGAVYLVEDRKHDNARVALKVLVNKEAFDQHTCTRFHKEWEISKELRHPNLVKAYDLIKLNDAVAFTMEYVEGGDLRQLITDDLPDWNKIDSIFIQLLDALDYLHQHKLYHRDIKLENIMLTPDGRVKLSDLGLMKLTNSPQSNGQKLTKTGILLGTAQYMPPEYIISSQYDQCSDLYAVGIVLYEILSGARWLSDMRGNDVITHLVKTNFVFPKIERIVLPDKYQYILHYCLKAKSRKRFQSAREVKACFQRSSTDPFWRQPRLENDVKCPTDKASRTPITVSDIDDNDEITFIKRPTIFATLGLGALLAVAGVATTVYSWQTRAIDLVPGTYQGDLKDYASNTAKPVQLQVGPVGAVLTSGSDFCPSGFLSFKDKTLTCGARRFWAAGKDVNGKSEIKIFSWLGQQAIIKVTKIN